MALGSVPVGDNERALDFLLRTQNSDGSWPVVLGDDQGGAYVTSLTVIALRDLVSAIPARLRAIHWLLRCAGKESNWIWKWKFRTADRHVSFDPAPWSVPESSGSTGPALLAGLAVVDSPRGLILATPAALGLLSATALSCGVSLRSWLLHATGSSLAFAFAPTGGGATAAAADPGSPSSIPRSSGSDLPVTTSTTVVRPAGRSSACALSWCESRPHLQCPTENAAAQQELKPLRMPARFHSHAHRFPSSMQFTVELLRFLGVLQSALTALSCLLINERYLLETRVIIASYNQHRRLLSPRPLIG